MLQKETRCIKSRGWKLLEFEDQGQLYFMQVSSVASEGQY